MANETGCFSISLSKPLLAVHFRTKINRIPNSKGSVGRNILIGSPRINSDSGNDSGVKKTTRYSNLSSEKTASKMMTKTSGKAFRTSECFITIKYVFSKINSAESR